MKSDWMLEISLIEKDGARSYHRAVSVPVGVLGEHTVSNIRADHRAGVATAPVADIITLMKDRQFRRELFIALCTNMGGLLADYLEDHEGWHGPERQESAQDHAKTQAA